MHRTIAAAAVASVSACGLGQGVTLMFSADQTSAAPGDTVRWRVSAGFTGYDDPSAYFGGFVGDFPASDPRLGVAMNCVSHMAGNSTTPTIDGASLLGLDMFNSALFGSNDPSNPIDVFEFDVLITADDGVLSYGADGVADLYPDSGIFTLPDEYNAADIVGSDLVVIGEAPCNAADLAPPYGILDLDDVTAFAGCIIDGCFSMPDRLEQVSAFRSSSILECDDPSDDFCTSFYDESTGFGAWTSMMQSSVIDPVAVTGDLGATYHGWGSWDYSNSTSLEYTFVLTADTFAVLDTVIGISNPSGAAATTAGFSLRSHALNITHSTPGAYSYRRVLPAGLYELTSDARISDSMYPDGATASVRFDLVFTCGPADLAEPYAVLDLADVVAFVGAFVDGCP